MDNSKKRREKKKKKKGRSQREGEREMGLSVNADRKRGRNVNRFSEIGRKVGFSPVRVNPRVLFATAKTNINNFKFLKF